MSKKIYLYTNRKYGIGITGKLNKIDINNLYGDDNTIFISIYEKENDKYYIYTMKATNIERKENKELIVKSIEEKLLEIL